MIKVSLRSDLKGTDLHTPRTLDKIQVSILWLEHIINIDKMNEYLKKSLHILPLSLAIATLQRIKDNLSSSFRVRNSKRMDTALSNNDCQKSAYHLQCNNTWISSSTQWHVMDKHVRCLSYVLITASFYSDVLHHI